MSRRALAVLAVVALPRLASAWEPIRCLDDSGPARYRDGVVPPLGLAPRGPASDDAVRRAVATWNAVPGARAELALGPEVPGCVAPELGGRIAWSDPAACYSIAGFAAGVTVHTFDERDPCEIVAVEVLLDSEGPNVADPGFVEAVALHELGHVLLLDHEWDELSVMGYPSSAGSLASAPFADDHEARLAVAPDGSSPPPSIALRPFRPASPIVPGQQSYTRSYGPGCAPGGCLSADERTALLVDVTVENVGASPREDELRVLVRLVPVDGGAPTPLAEYVFPGVEAHSSWSGALGGVPPAELPEGLYDLTVTLEAGGLAEAQLDPSARELVYPRSFQRIEGTRADPAAYLEDDEPPPSGCGCGAGEPSALGAWLLPVVLGGRARRRGRPGRAGR